MIGMTYASVPLYRMFCQATGYGGTVQQGSTVEDKIRARRENPNAELEQAAASREITVSFVGNVIDGLPWKFTPTQRSVTVRPGESTLAFYTAKNRSERDITGVSTYNVAPQQAGAYFNKIQCFCFEEQRLRAGEQVDMPLFFYLDPEFATDPRMDSINNLTLSYTFFKVDDADYDEAELKTQADRTARAVRSSTFTFATLVSAQSSANMTPKPHAIRELRALILLTLSSTALPSFALTAQSSNCTSFSGFSNYIFRAPLPDSPHLAVKPSFLEEHLLFFYTIARPQMSQAAVASFCLDQCVTFKPDPDAPPFPTEDLPESYVSNRTGPCGGFTVDLGEPAAPGGGSNETRWYCEAFDQNLSLDNYEPNDQQGSYLHALGVNRACDGSNYRAF
ncbi:hypothetical protein WJX73_010461 [Symbiochloris irregularis]|uniref:Uncharacterized protein n=1 Tax=Symbiochloris irregularis TaxID=706552 RepID=A0AAW1PNR4_9CHLO